MAKFGTPEWKSIHETRSATIVPMYEVSCGMCGGDRRIYLGPSFSSAADAKEKHDANHSTGFAECCMVATSSVCECGNVLV